MARMMEGFDAILSGFSLDTLERNSGSVYALSEELKFIYLNPAWFTFAAENEGEPSISERFAVGSFFGDALSGSANDYYLDAFGKVLKSGKVWTHDYECSTPQTYRLFHQSVYPLHNGKGLVAVNSLVKEHPHDSGTRKAHSAVARLYTQRNGFINQCSNCRRVQRAAERQVWDWVPAWVERLPENTSHTFCQICYEYYYQFKPSR